MNTYEYLDNILRFDEWQEHCFTTNVVIIFLIAPFLSAGINIAAILFLWIFLEMVWLYAFMINDWYDKEVDRSAGKVKIIHSWTKARCFAVYGSQVAIGLASAYMVCGLSYKIIIAILAFFFATIYSAPPRFKTRGVFGGIILSFGTGVAPVLFVLAVFDTYPLFCVPFIIAVIFSEITDNLRHHIKDYNTDKEKIRTFVTEKGVERTDAMLYAVDVAATLCIILVFSLFAYELYINNLIYLLLAVMILLVSWIIFIKKYVSREVHKDYSRILMKQHFIFLISLVICLFVNMISLYILLLLSALTSKLFLRRVLGGVR